jgi:hypothetical protein
MAGNKKTAYTVAMTIIVSVILTILIISLVNVGLSIFLERPDYNDFCPLTAYKEPIPENTEVLGGTCSTVSPDSREECCINKGYTEYDEESGGCIGVSQYTDYQKCQNDYDNAMSNYNQIRYYVFAGIGFVLLLTGLFTTMLMLQITGFASGAILLIEGVVTNFENKITVFVTLLIIFVVFGILAWRIVEKS